ncbi:hypothetical protein D4764_17G0005280 [Takifugu flavidus]|uniref:Uncharacterized protein n=1 Tax=Takifugu flavidus TaxID=433684 RepID=A0A5C6NVQ5_9TELE|nr:hypothetical protein D4764_17G0005280 [Takifugu flavidus]
MRLFCADPHQVAVHDHVWTQEEPSVGPPDPGDHQRGGGPLSAGEISTRVAVYTLYLSGLKQRYRQFIRQPDGAIIEVTGDIEGSDNAVRKAASPSQSSASQRHVQECTWLPTRKRRFKSE